MTTTSPPPPYTASEGGSNSQSDAILQSIRAAAPQPYRIYDQTTRLEAEKLRYFLIYILVVDYSVSARVTLDAPTRKHYLSLAGNLLDFRDYAEASTSEDRDVLVACF